MGVLVMNPAFTCASAVISCGSISTRASPSKRNSHAWTSSPPRRLITSCQAGAPSQEPLQNGETLYPHGSLSSSPLSYSSSSSSSSPSPSCLTIGRDIVRGERIEHPGTIVVKGNVNSGAVIHASGDIVVLGQLEGEAHAGTNGDAQTMIFAGQLKSQTLSIAGCDAKESAINGSYFCTIASLSHGEVRVGDVGSHNIFAPSTRDRDYAKPWFSVDVRTMRKSSKVAAFTGAYIFIIGVALLLFPESLFGLFFNLKSSVTEWIRVGAVLAVVFGIYYIGTAWGDAMGCSGADSFYMSTVVGRMFIFFIFSWLVASGAGGLPLFIVGMVNLLGALTMLNALRGENMPRRST